MDRKDFERIEADYYFVKEMFQEDIVKASKYVSKYVKDFPIFEKVFPFLIDSFEGKFRKGPDKTPLVFHSIYLVKLLYDFEERDEDTLLIAALHDVLEDTRISENILIGKNFLRGKGYLIDKLKILKENKNLSREPDGKTLPERYREHISRIVGAPKDVINVEIVDRFSDIMDLEYIIELPEDEKMLRLESKMIKVKSFVNNIIKGRNDHNKDCVKLFNYRIKQLEEKYGLISVAELLPR